MQTKDYHNLESVIFKFNNEKDDASITKCCGPKRFLLKAIRKVDFRKFEKFIPRLLGVSDKNGLQLRHQQVETI